MDPAIEQAVERARKGDAAAFDVIVLEFGTPLVRFLCGVLAGDVHAAHDVAQDAFLAAWRTLPHLEHPSLFRAWLYRVAYHRAITWLRRRGPRGAPFRFLDEEGSAAASPAAPIPEPDGDGVVTERLRAALAALPPAYAAAVTLHYFQGLGTHEMAEALGVSRSTVKMRLLRAREVLREALLGDAPHAVRPSKPARRPKQARPATTRKGAAARDRRPTPRISPTPTDARSAS